MPGRGKTRTYFMLLSMLASASVFQTMAGRLSVPHGADAGCSTLGLTASSPSKIECVRSQASKELNSVVIKVNGLNNFFPKSIFRGGSTDSSVLPKSSQRQVGSVSTTSKSSLMRMLSSPSAANSGAWKDSALFKRFRFGRGGYTDKKRVLILMSDTGGGHRASALALHQAMDDQFPGKFDVNIMDIWTDHANFPFNRFVPTYRYLAKHPMMWRGFYMYGNFPPTKLFTEVWSWRNSYKSFKHAIEESDPDFVVSVHPLCQLMPISIVKEMNKKRSPEKPKIPFVTVVTDLGGAHRTWFDKRADLCYVPSEPVRRIALKNGIRPEKILNKGLPIRPSFWKESKPKVSARKSLGLSEKDRTVLLMGGGDGVGGLQHIASAVAAKLNAQKTPSQMVVICGHNKKMSDSLEQNLKPEHTKVVVKGFVDNIDEYMTASDCLVTKAGPGTIAESMIRGLPLVISSYLPGQEYGNVPYVVEGGFGLYTGNRPRKIADTVCKLFNNDSLLQEMSCRAKLLSHPESTQLIAKDIAEMALGTQGIEVSTKESLRARHVASTS